jgi:ribonuclease HI
MEILACIVGLKALKQPCDVTVYSDSKYVVNTMTKSWALRWKRLGWKRRTKTGELHDALNPDLWTQMLDLCDQHRVEFSWVRGHDGSVENERCDQLARAAAASRNLAIDTAYERPASITNSRY